MYTIIIKMMIKIIVTQILYIYTNTLQTIIDSFLNISCGYWRYAGLVENVGLKLFYYYYHSENVIIY